MKLIGFNCSYNSHSLSFVLFLNFFECGIRGAVFECFVSDICGAVVLFLSTMSNIYICFWSPEIAL